MFRPRDRHAYSSYHHLPAVPRFRRGVSFLVVAGHAATYDASAVFNFTAS